MLFLLNTIWKHLLKCVFREMMIYLRNNRKASKFCATSNNAEKKKIYCSSEYEVLCDIYAAKKKKRWIKISEKIFFHRCFFFEKKIWFKTALLNIISETENIFFGSLFLFCCIETQKKQQRRVMQLASVIDTVWQASIGGKQQPMSPAWYGEQRKKFGKLSGPLS